MTVYFIKDPSTNRVKIGHTTRKVEERLKELQTGSSSVLEIVRLEPGSKALESTYQKLFISHRSHREWFDISGELAEFLENSHTYYDVMEEKKKLEKELGVALSELAGMTQERDKLMSSESAFEVLVATMENKIKEMKSTIEDMEAAKVSFTTSPVSAEEINRLNDEIRRLKKNNQIYKRDYIHIKSTEYTTNHHIQLKNLHQITFYIFSMAVVAIVLMVALSKLIT